MNNSQKTLMIVGCIIYVLLMLSVVFDACIFIEDESKSMNETFREVEANIKNPIIYSVPIETTSSIELIESIEKETEKIEESKTTEIETDKEVDTKSEEPQTQPDVNEYHSAFLLSDYERWVVECMVMGESGGEPHDGQIAVAQCILNACLKDGIEPSEVRKKYKYSGWNESPTESVKEAVSDVFDKGYKITDKFILYFYAPKYVYSSWHETQCFVMQIGGHRFFAEWE